MPQKTFLNPEGNKQEKSGMWTFIKTIGTLVCLVLVFGVGYMTANLGYRVTDSAGKSLVPTNAAQIVKDENARLGQQVIGKTEAEAEELLRKNNRTMFVGIKDGKAIEYKGQKTFTNLTLESKDNKIVKVMGWY